MRDQTKTAGLPGEDIRKGRASGIEKEKFDLFIFDSM
jgi:hypothetical protein